MKTLIKIMIVMFTLLAATISFKVILEIIDLRKKRYISVED